MYKVKPLIWSQDDEGIIYSEPPWLKWGYYIIPVNEKFQLILIDSYGEINHNYSKDCLTLEMAKSMAVNHYLDIINNFIEYN